MEESGGVRVHRRESGDHEAPDVVRELARAKDRLAQELEANLRQLRQVIEESERIAREMELVLKEVNSPTALAVPASVLRELERGGGRPGDGASHVH